MRKAKPPVFSGRGIIIPAEWDSEGHPVALKLSMANEKEYMIKQNKLAEELFDFINKNVLLKGTLVKGGNNLQEILIADYFIYENQ